MAGKRGMTLIEILVVIGIIAAIVAILVPSLTAMRERTQRASCANNMRQLHMNFMTIATDNNGELLKAFEEPDGRRNPVAVDPDDAEVLVELGMLEAEVVTQVDEGISGQYAVRPNEIWRCPSAEAQVGWQAVEDADRLETGYQYLGGVEQWYNDAGQFEARSPVRVGQAQNAWVLLADRSAWDAGLETWTGRTHGAAEYASPEGQNQLYFDGSAGWVERVEPVYLHSGDPDQLLFIDQDDLGEYGRTVAEGSRTRMSDY